MKDWLRVSLLICAVGVVRETRPSDAFLTEYQTGPWINATLEVLTQEVFPISTYAYSCQLIIVFLVTDFLRYKPLIIFMSICGIITWSLLIWAKTIAALQAVEFFYGTYLSLEVAYYTYIYAKVDKVYYQRVTSHARSALLIGKLLGSVSSQLLIYFKLMDYRQLNYITLSTQICSMIVAILLPKVDSSLYFHRKDESIGEIDLKSKEESSKINKIMSVNQPKKAFLLLWYHFYNAYTNPMVLNWSLWYIIGYCGHLQVVGYIQLLWKTIDSSQPIVWNGAVDGIYTLLGAGFALAAGYIFKIQNNQRLSLLALAALTIFEGLFILLAAWTKSLYVCYVGYICFGALFSFTVTVSSAQVARHLEDDSFGLVFGVNSFIALILQTILTVVVVSKNGFALNVIDQYTVYAFYFIVIGGLYFVGVIIEFIIRKYFLSDKNR